eukprot:gene10692-11865_t
MGKSAQIGLHTWLPDAMEGPTPVSALIHAATMVTAGVFLVCRCSYLFEQSPFVLSIVTIVGASTAFFAATTGLFQNDMKKVIAYSTCSQLGYMVFACGLSSYDVGMFHLSNHAFFKALLFLGAGSVIHAVSDEQDMRSLALVGFPFLAGFYSKDIILEVSGSTYTTVGLFSYILAEAWQLGIQDPATPIAEDEIIDPVVTLKVVGHQWYWSYEYSDYATLEGGETLNFDSYMIPTSDLTVGTFRLLEVDNRVVLPIKTHIRVLVTAADVLHSWAIPSFGVKIDATPGRLSQISLFIKRQGVYYGQCSEICGVNHGFMPIVVRGVSTARFTKWIAAKLDNLVLS